MILEQKRTGWLVTLGGLVLAFLATPLVVGQAPIVLLLLFSLPLMGVFFYAHLDWGVLLILLLAPVSQVIADFLPESQLTLWRDFMLMGLFGLWVLRRQLERNQRVPNSVLGSATLPMLFVCLSVLCGVGLGLLQRSAVQVLFGVKVLVFYLPLSIMIADQVKTARDAQRVARVIVVAAVWASAYMVFKYLAPADFYPQYDRFHRDIGSQAFGRLMTTDLVRLNALTLPVLGALVAWRAQSLKWRVLGSMGFLFLLCVLAIGGKRFVLIAAAVGVVVVVWLTRRWHLGVVLICGLLLAFWFLPERGYDRWLWLVEGQDRSSDLRVEELQSFWFPYVLSHPMGSGVGTFSAISGFSAAWEGVGHGFTTVWWRGVEFSQVHNGFLLVYAELGIVGLLSYLWWIWSVVRGCFRTIRVVRDGTVRVVAVGVISTLVTFVVHDLAAPGIITFPVSFYFWAFCGLGIAVSRIGRTTEAQKGVRRHAAN